MVTHIGQMKTVPGKEAEFETAASRAFAIVRAGDGCKSVILKRSVENANTYYVIIEWETIPHHRTFELEHSHKVRAHIEEYVTDVVNQHFEDVQLELGQ